jgi:hypothetical protein
MKNIHVLPTDKPSRLYFNTKAKYYAFSYTVTSQGGSVSNRHIYITNDEEIKQPCWCWDILQKRIYWVHDTIPQYPTIGNYFKKIILTTDQDLIKNGVQAIDDEFLEWFVKNPSCEFVEVDREEDELISPKNPKIRFNALQDPPSFISAESLNNMILTYKYKIIIPQEKHKQETLEEAARKYASYNFDSSFLNIDDHFEAGAKWQQEQDKNKFYCEEFELIKYIQWIIRKIDAGNTPEEIVRLVLFNRDKIEQFKKK